MRAIIRIAVAAVAAVGIALGAATVTGPDMHFHGTPVASSMYHHG
jgi:hypothetical protein